MIENICTNIIHINYYGTDDENLTTSKEIYRILKKKFEVYSYDEDEDGLITDYQFDSKWTAPLMLLDELSEKYKIDIIGVAYEFQDGYVESFEILANLDQEEMGQFSKVVTDPNIKDGVDTIILPENELRIFDDLEDDINVSDKEIVEWKDKELEDWQKEVIKERDRSIKTIENLIGLIDIKTGSKEEHLLKYQLESLRAYCDALNKRIKLFNE